MSDNTMAKPNKDKQCNTKHIEERQKIPWPKPTRTNNVIQNTSKNVRQYHGQTQQGQTMQYKTHRRTSDNTIKPTRTNNVIQNTSKNVRKYHDQRQGQAMLYKTHRQTIPWQTQQGQTMQYKTHRRTSDNTTAKTNKDKQCNTKHIEERQTIPWPKPTRTNNVIQNTSKNVRQYHSQNQQGKTMLYKTHRRTLDNTIAKTNKYKQCYMKHIEERQTIPWPKPTRTNNVIQNTYHSQKTSDNTMAKTNKDKQCNAKHIEERQTIPWPKPTRTNNVIQNTSKNVRQYHGQNQQGQTMLYTIPWPKPTRTNNVIQNTSKNVRQYHGQNQQGQTMFYKIHRRTSDNTMAKTNKDKQCNTKYIEERQTIPWPKPTSTNNCYTKHIEERQTIPWPKPTRTNNVIQNTSENKQYHGPNQQDKQCYMKHIDRKYHGQNQQGQTMYKKYIEDRQYHSQNQQDKQCYMKHIDKTIPWPKPTSTHNVIQNTSKNVRQYHSQNQ